MRVFDRRVVITGLGLVTPVGVDTAATWAGLLAGRSGIGPITRFDATEYPVRIAGEVTDFDPKAYLSPRDAKKMDRFIQFAVAASRMAVADAGLEPLPDPDRTGVLIGVGLGGLETLEQGFEVVATRGPKRVSPFTIPKLIANLAPGTVVLDKYRVLGMAGRGGMAVVHRGIQTALGREVAVKRGTSGDPQATAQFVAEAKITGLV